MGLGIHARGATGPDGLSVEERGLLAILEMCAAHGDPLPELDVLAGCFGRGRRWLDLSLDYIELAGHIRRGRGSIELRRPGRRLDRKATRYCADCPHRRKH